MDTAQIIEEAKTKHTTLQVAAIIDRLSPWDWRCLDDLVKSEGKRQFDFFQVSMGFTDEDSRDWKLGRLGLAIYKAGDGRPVWITPLGLLVLSVKGSLDS